MTVRGVVVTARLMWAAGAVVAAAVLAMFLIVVGTDRSAAATATISCDAETAVFGDTITCTVDAGGDTDIDWGDGHTEPATTTAARAVEAVGPVTISVVSTDGAVLATDTVTIAVDLHVECEYGDTKPVYELAPALEGALQPYDYVYLLADGTKVVPGDADYPADLYARLDLELSVLGEEPIIGRCEATSAAVETLDGHVTYVVEDGWYPTTNIRTRKATPGTRGHWDGVQPIDVTVVAEAAGFQASEQMGVYWGGCG